MPVIYNRKCNYCTKNYSGVGRLYCSFKCRARDNIEFLKKQGEKGRKIRWEKDQKRGRYIECLGCGKERWEYPFAFKKGYGKFCSKNCSNVFNASKLSNDRKGRNNPRYGKKPWNYIDGKKSHYYTKQFWINIAKKVRKRDNNMCQECGRFAYLVHHKVPRRWGGGDNASNLEVLCYQCHAEKHRILRLGVV